MKRQFTVFAIMTAVALLTTGCPPPESPEPDTLDIVYEGVVNNSLTIDIPVEGGEFSFGVKANNGFSRPLWYGGEWATVSPTLDVDETGVSVVNIIAEPNIGAARSAELVVKSSNGTVSRTVTLAQMAAPENITPSFSEVDMYYNPWEYDIDTGQFELYFYDDDNNHELYIESFGNYYDHYMDATLTEGTYTFANTYALRTFNGDSQLTIWDEESGDDTLIAVVGGQFTLTKNGENYSVNGSFELANGEILICDYNGAIFNEYAPNVTSDVAVDFTIPSWKDVEVYDFGDGRWVVNIWIETAIYQEAVLLGINTEKDMGSLPTGRFPMAEVIGRDIAGTAEPFYVYENDLFGCGWSRASVFGTWEFTYGIPGEGFVDIDKNGDIYTIGFSFTDPNGYTVSGEYIGDDIYVNSFNNTYTETKKNRTRSLSPKHRRMVRN